MFAFILESNVLLSKANKIWYFRLTALWWVEDQTQWRFSICHLRWKVFRFVCQWQWLRLNSFECDWIFCSQIFVISKERGRALSVIGSDRGEPETKTFPEFSQSTLVLPLIIYSNHQLMFGSFLISCRGSFSQDVYHFIRRKKSEGKRCCHSTTRGRGCAVRNCMYACPRTKTLWLEWNDFILLFIERKEIVHET